MQGAMRKVLMAHRKLQERRERRRPWEEGSTRDEVPVAATERDHKGDWETLNQMEGKQTIINNNSSNNKCSSNIRKKKGLLCS